MSAAHDAVMEEDADVIEELEEIHDALTDYLPPDDEMTPRLKKAIDRLKEFYYERYGQRL